MMVGDGTAVASRRAHDFLPRAPVVVLGPLVVGRVRSAPCESEVEASAVEIGVRLVGRGGETTVDAVQAIERVAVERRELRPRGGHFDRVDDDPGPRDRGKSRDVVSVPEPGLDKGIGER